MIKTVKKGLDLPITGAVTSDQVESKAASRVAVIGSDYWWMKPTMAVKVGDTVAAGQLLFSCKRCEDLRFTAPVSGKVVEINRGDKRVFQSLVIERAGNEAINFEKYKGPEVSSYSSQELTDLLLESGVWTALRARPYSYIARPNEKAKSIFVTAMDTNPLAIDPSIFINKHNKAFETGLQVLKKLTDGPVHLCVSADTKINLPSVDGVQTHQFGGVHPAGNVGTHIHFIDPVGEKKHVWHIGYQHVVSIGKLIESGKIFNDRMISLAGPACRKPKYIETIEGANLNELIDSESYDFNQVRVVSGSVFNGRNAQGPFNYLGRYHNQVTLLHEGHEREFLGWHAPGLNKFSVKSVFLSKLMPGKKFSFNTNTNGSARSLVPIGSFEKVMPMDILPTHLLRSLLSNDTEMAAKLGALELDEEDLALCTFVDPCKHEFGPVLRSNLETILKEG